MKGPIHGPFDHKFNIKTLMRNLVMRSYRHQLKLVN